MSLRSLTLTLFTGFAGVLLFVKWLDGYSARYQLCSQLWQASAEAARGSPFFAQRVDELLAAPDKLQMGGKTCPKLLGGHEKIVRAHIEADLNQSRRQSLR